MRQSDDSEQLEALAVYRTHKHCHCEDCETARQSLKDYDDGKERSKPQIGESVPLRFSRPRGDSQPDGD